MRGIVCSVLQVSVCLVVTIFKVLDSLPLITLVHSHPAQTILFVTTVTVRSDFTSARAFFKN